MALVLMTVRGAGLGAIGIYNQSAIQRQSSRVPNRPARIGVEDAAPVQETQGTR